MTLLTLDSGRPRVHEPAFDPDPDHYVTWEYARGYTDGVHDTLLEDDEDENEDENEDDTDD